MEAHRQTYRQTHRQTDRQTALDIMLPWDQCLQDKHKIPLPLAVREPAGSPVYSVYVCMRVSVLVKCESVYVFGHSHMYICMYVNMTG